MGHFYGLTAGENDEVSVSIVFPPFYQMYVNRMTKIALRRETINNCQSLLTKPVNCVIEFKFTTNVATKSPS